MKARPRDGGFAIAPDRIRLHNSNRIASRPVIPQLARDAKFL